MRHFLSILAYRYTDLIEIYSPEGQQKKNLQGPNEFDIIFTPKESDGVG